jgi:hypothetical protein
MRLDEGQIVPAVQNQLWAYAFASRETLEVDTTFHLPDPKTMSDAELEDAILAQADKIRAERDAK